MRTIPRICGLILLATMTACGGSGGDSPPPTTSASGTAEGIWQGRSSTTRTIRSVVREDGLYLVWYSPAGYIPLVAGLVQGTGQSVNGVFTSADARDFNLEGHGVLRSQIDGTYVARQSLNGQITYDPVTVTTFTSTFDPASETTMTLAEVAGTYEGQGGSVSVWFPATTHQTTVTISGQGVVTGHDTNGCAFHGQVTPHGSTFDLMLQFAVPFCQYPDLIFSGAVLLDVSTHRLLAGAVLDRSAAVVFEGDVHP